jgi:hypothetical protein
VSKKLLTEQSLILESIEISDIEQNEDYNFGVELIPSECWTLHFYTDKGSYRFREINLILN